MEMFIFFGAFSLLFGTLFLFAPKALMKVNEWSSRAVAKTEDMAFGHRVGLGFFLIVISAVMFYIAYSVGR